MNTTNETGQPVVLGAPYKLSWDGKDMEEWFVPCQVCHHQVFGLEVHVSVDFFYDPERETSFSAAYGLLLVVDLLDMEGLKPGFGEGAVEAVRRFYEAERLEGLKGPAFIEVES